MADTPPTLALLSEQHANARPDALAIVEGDRRWNWAAFHEEVLRTVAVLRELGVQPGERIGYLGYNRDRYIVLLQACYRAAIVLAPMNWRLAPPEIEAILRSSGVRLLFVDDDFADLGTQAAGAAGVPVIALEAGPEALAARTAAALPDPNAAPSAPDTIALLLYSSGTTGRPKGVLLTHDNLLTGLRDARSVGERWGAWLPDERVLLATPIFHIGGTGWVTQALTAGAAAITIPRPEVAAMVRAILDERVTKFFAVPTILSMIMRDEQAIGADWSSVRHVLYGAAPISLALLQEAMAAFANADFIQLYGATETTGSVTYLPPAAHSGSDSALAMSRQSNDAGTTATRGARSMIA